jgi:hypothetical protein
MQAHFFHRSLKIRWNGMNGRTEELNRDHDNKRHDHPGDDGGHAAKCRSHCEFSMLLELCRL